MQGCYERLIKKIAKEAKKNPKAFFAYACSKTKTRDGIAYLDQEDGGQTSTSEDNARVLNSFFSSVFAKDNLENSPEFHDRNFEEALLDIEITPEAVAKKLQG